jgi:hypothetical protein
MGYPIAFKLKKRGTIGRLLISMALYARAHTCPNLSADRLLRSEFEKEIVIRFFVMALYNVARRYVNREFHRGSGKKPVLY